MCAVDLPTPELRGRVVRRCFDDGMIVLKCGPRSVRFRPTLSVTAEAISEGVRDSSARSQPKRSGWRALVAGRVRATVPSARGSQLPNDVSPADQAALCAQRAREAVGHRN
jgi:hypothetical protein